MTGLWGKIIFQCVRYWFSINYTRRVVDVEKGFDGLVIPSEAFGQYHNLWPGVNKLTYHAIIASIPKGWLIEFRLIDW